MLTGAEREVVWLSVQVAAASVVVGLVPAVALAWVLARWRSPWREALRAAVMLPLVLPPVVTGYLLLLLLGRSGPLGALWHRWTGGHLAYTTGACVIAAAVVGFPLLVESVRVALLGIDRRLEQVSRSLGRGPLSTFVRVPLPLSATGIAAGAVLCFARALGEFGATIVVAGNIVGETRTIPVAVYTLLNQPGQEAAIFRLVALSVTLSLLALVASSLLTRRRIPRRADG